MECLSAGVMRARGSEREGTARAWSCFTPPPIGLLPNLSQVLLHQGIRDKNPGPALVPDDRYRLCDPPSALARPKTPSVLMTLSPIALAQRRAFRPSKSKPRERQRKPLSRRAWPRRCRHPPSSGGGGRRLGVGLAQPERLLVEAGDLVRV